MSTQRRQHPLSVAPSRSKPAHRPQSPRRALLLPLPTCTCPGARPSPHWTTFRIRPRPSPCLAPKKDAVVDSRILVAVWCGVSPRQVLSRCGTPRPVSPLLLRATAMSLSPANLLLPPAPADKRYSLPTHHVAAVDICLNEFSLPIVRPVVGVVGSAHQSDSHLHKTNRQLTKHNKRFLLPHLIKKKKREKATLRTISHSFLSYSLSLSVRSSSALFCLTPDSLLG
mmetsp:Transcript_25097/g.63075  ORF Transcript_25097/g.63075 Transcript_25097/m.63075 type:complete len:226 (-) Transcript_25097:1066-1743(-)